MKQAALAATLCGLCACGGSSNPSAPVTQAKSAVQTAAVATQAKPAAPAAPPLQDAAGNLLPSGERVAWLELPRGLSSFPTGRTVEHLFKARGIAIDRIQAFFGARVVAASTRRQGTDGIVMTRGAPTSGAQPKQTTLDVSVLRGSTPDEVLVYIYERPYEEPRPDFTDANARALLKQQLKRAE